MANSIAESYDPEECPSVITVNKDALLRRTSHAVLGELAAYFEFLRQSLRNIVIDAEQYKTQARLLYKESFWETFVTKAMSERRVETQIWDFKNTLEMWHCDAEKKTDFQIDFAEHVASFANADGGILIIGITDKFPRKPVGIKDLENKIKSAKLALNTFIQRPCSVHFQQITLKDSNSKYFNCLIIAIADASSVVKVKHKDGKFSYPLRQGTGKIRSDFETISSSKKRGIQHDNYDFLQSLEDFIKG